MAENTIAHDEKIEYRALAFHWTMDFVSDALFDGRLFRI